MGVNREISEIMRKQQQALLLPHKTKHNETDQVIDLNLSASDQNPKLPLLEIGNEEKEIKRLDQLGIFGRFKAKTWDKFLDNFPKLLEAGSYLIVKLGTELFGLIDPSKAKSLQHSYKETTKSLLSNSIWGSKDESLKEESFRQELKRLNIFSYAIDGIIDPIFGVFDFLREELTRGSLILGRLLGRLSNSDQSLYISYLEYRELEGKETLLKYSKELFGIGEVLLSLAATLASGGGASAVLTRNKGLRSWLIKERVNIFALSNRLGVSGLFGFGGALGEELLQDEGYKVDLSRLATNTKEGAFHSLKFGAIASKLPSKLGSYTDKGDAFGDAFEVAVVDTDRIMKEDQFGKSPELITIVRRSLGLLTKSVVTAADLYDNPNHEVSKIHQEQQTKSIEHLEYVTPELAAELFSESAQLISFKDATEDLLNEEIVIKEQSFGVVEFSGKNLNGREVKYRLWSKDAWDHLEHLAESRVGALSDYERGIINIPVYKGQDQLSFLKALYEEQAHVALGTGDSFSRGSGDNEFYVKIWREAKLKNKLTNYVPKSVEEILLEVIFNFGADSEQAKRAIKTAENIVPGFKLEQGFRTILQSNFLPPLKDSPFKNTIAANHPDMELTQWLIAEIEKWLFAALEEKNIRLAVQYFQELLKADPTGEFLDNRELSKRLDQVRVSDFSAFSVEEQCYANVFTTFLLNICLSRRSEQYGVKRTSDQEEYFAEQLANLELLIAYSASAGSLDITRCYEQQFIEKFGYKGVSRRDLLVIRAIEEAASLIRNTVLIAYLPAHVLQLLVVHSQLSLQMILKDVAKLQESLEKVAEDQRNACKIILDSTRINCEILILLLKQNKTKRVDLSSILAGTEHVNYKKTEELPEAVIKEIKEKLPDIEADPDLIKLVMSLIYDHYFYYIIRDIAREGQAKQIIHQIRYDSENDCVIITFSISEEVDPEEYSFLNPFLYAATVALEMQDGELDFYSDDTKGRAVVEIKIPAFTENIDAKISANQILDIFFKKSKKEIKCQDALSRFTEFFETYHQNYLEIYDTAEYVAIISRLLESDPEIKQAFIAISAEVWAGTESSAAIAEDIYEDILEKAVRNMFEFDPIKFPGDRQTNITTFSNIIALHLMMLGEQKRVVLAKEIFRKILIVDSLTHFNENIASLLFLTLGLAKNLKEETILQLLNEYDFEFVSTNFTLDQIRNFLQVIKVFIASENKEISKIANETATSLLSWLTTIDPKAIREYSAREIKKIPKGQYDFEMDQIIFTRLAEGVHEMSEFNIDHENNTVSYTCNVDGSIWDLELVYPNLDDENHDFAFVLRDDPNCFFQIYLDKIKGLEVGGINKLCVQAKKDYPDVDRQLKDYDLPRGEYLHLIMFVRNERGTSDGDMLNSALLANLLSSRYGYRTKFIFTNTPTNDIHIILYENGENDLDLSNVIISMYTHGNLNGNGMSFSDAVNFNDDSLKNLRAEFPHTNFVIFPVGCYAGRIAQFLTQIKLESRFLESNSFHRAIEQYFSVFYFNKEQEVSVLTSTDLDDLYVSAEMFLLMQLLTDPKNKNRTFGDLFLEMSEKIKSFQRTHAGAFIARTLADLEMEAETEVVDLSILTPDFEIDPFVPIVPGQLRSQEGLELVDLSHYVDLLCSRVNTNGLEVNVKTVSVKGQPKYLLVREQAGDALSVVIYPYPEFDKEGQVSLYPAYPYAAAAYHASLPGGPGEQFPGSIMQLTSFSDSSERMSLHYLQGSVSSTRLKKFRKILCASIVIKISEQILAPDMTLDQLELLIPIMQILTDNKIGAEEKALYDFIVKLLSAKESCPEYTGKITDQVNLVLAKAAEVAHVLRTELSQSKLEPYGLALLENLSLSKSFSLYESVNRLITILNKDLSPNYNFLTRLLFREYFSSAIPCISFDLYQTKILKKTEIQDGPFLIENFTDELRVQILLEEAAGGDYQTEDIKIEGGKICIVNPVVTFKKAAVSPISSEN